MLTSFALNGPYAPATMRFYMGFIGERDLSELSEDPDIFAMAQVHPKPLISLVVSKIRGIIEGKRVSTGAQSSDLPPQEEQLL